MYRLNLSLLFVMAFLLIITGCSGQNREASSIVGLNDALSVQVSEVSDNQSDREFWGTWDVKFDLEKMQTSIEQARTVDFHFNVKSYIPSPGIVIKSWDPLSHTVGVDVTINNPYSINGYDVRVIIYTDSIGHILLNEDNWTPLFDIAGGMDINPFKAYNKTSPLRQFPAHTASTENLQIYLPGNNPNVKFAIDASYPGNCQEPYELSGFHHSALYENAGSYCDAIIEALDWQNDVNHVYISCTSIMGIEPVEFELINGTKYQAKLYNTEGASPGDYQAMVWASSANSGSLYLYGNVVITVSTAAHIRSVGYVDKPSGDTWYDICVQPDGPVYICADHPETGNTELKRTAIAFDNDLTGMRVLNPGTGINDIGFGFTQAFNRIDVSQNGTIVNNTGIGYIGTWIVSGTTATAQDCCWSIICADPPTGEGFVPEVWNHLDDTYTNWLIGYYDIGPTCDMELSQWIATFILSEDGLTAPNAGGAWYMPPYDSLAIKGIDGLDGTRDVVFFVCNEGMSHLSVSGDWLTYLASPVEYSYIDKFGTGDGEFKGGLDVACDTDNNIFTLEEHGSGIYRFQKFDVNLNWIYSEWWNGTGNPMRMDFDKADDTLYLLCDSGVHICQVD